MCGVCWIMTACLSKPSVVLLLVRRLNNFCWILVLFSAMLVNKHGQEAFKHTLAYGLPL